jgi:hypothetical protein
MAGGSRREVTMAEAILFMMAECTRSCGWCGPAHERRAKGHAPEPLYCPRCSGGTKSWIVDQAKEQQAWLDLKDEWLKASQKSRAPDNQDANAQQRLKEAERELKRCQGRMSLVEADHSPDTLPYQEAQLNLLAAEREAAAAALARNQAVARVQALGK